MLNLTREDSGGTRAVGVGDRIAVTLPERPTTGYRWAPDVDPAALRLIDDDYEGPTRPIGAAGTRTLTFEVVALPAVLRLVEARSWERGVFTDEVVVNLVSA